MQRVTLNPSIAAILNIDSVGKSEIVPVYFTADENWVGTYELKLYNSDKKNKVITTPDEALTVIDQIMTLNIDPTLWNIDAKNHYYEISKTESKRVIFKGDLNIIE